MEKEQEISQELERERRAQIEKNITPPQESRAPVDLARFVWVAGTVVLDMATAYFIWKTTLFFYGILWLLIGAGGLVYSEYQRERVGNNERQEEIGQTGVYVSAGLVFLSCGDPGNELLAVHCHTRLPTQATAAFSGGLQTPAPTSSCSISPAPAGDRDPQATSPGGSHFTIPSTECCGCHLNRSGSTSGSGVEEDQSLSSFLFASLVAAGFVVFR